MKTIRVTDRAAEIIKRLRGNDYYTEIDVVNSALCSVVLNGYDLIEEDKNAMLPALVISQYSELLEQLSNDCMTPDERHEEIIKEEQNNGGPTL
jgi:hypothetical protein